VPETLPETLRRAGRYLSSVCASSGGPDDGRLANVTSLARTSSFAARHMFGLAFGLAFGVAFGLADARPADAQEVTNDARMHFSAGVNLLRDPGKPRYEEAYREFKTAYAIAPVTQILGNLALCAMMLERDAEAIDAYEKYLKGMLEIDPKDREQIERDLSTLKVGVARVNVSSNVKGVTIVDQRIRTQEDPVTNVYGPVDAPLALGIRRGHHVMTARAPGKPEQVWEFEAVAGEMPAHVFEFPEEQAPPVPAVPIVRIEPPPPERPIPRSFWYAAGATGVLGVATVVTGLFAVNARSDFEAANTGGTPERADDLRGTGQALNVTTDVLLTATVVGAAVTAFIYLTRPEKAPATAAWVRP
jgi:hypothetical protein